MTPITKMVVIEKRNTYLPHILCIALLWSVAMTMDYADQAAQAEERANSMTRQMAECLNGRWIGRTESGSQIGCMPAETVEPRKS